MSFQNVHAGFRMKLFRKNNSADTTGVLMAMIVSKDLDRSIKFEEASVVDAMNPDAVPVRKSVAVMETFDITGSGKADFKVYHDYIHPDFEAKSPVGYILSLDAPAAQGGGRYEGLFFIENLKLATADNGIVDFNFKLRGEGAITWTSASV